MLAQDSPGRIRLAVGACAVTFLLVGAGLAACAAKPAEAQLVETPAPRQALAPDRTLGLAVAAQSPHIVAVKRGLLEVRSEKGDKYARRYFEPGESFPVRNGAGWTVTTDDGSAFEWRLGDQSLGLVQAEGGPVYAQSVDLAMKRQPLGGPAIVPTAPSSSAATPKPIRLAASTPDQQGPPPAAATQDEKAKPAIEPQAPVVPIRAQPITPCEAKWSKRALVTMTGNLTIRQGDKVVRPEEVRFRLDGTETIKLVGGELPADDCKSDTLFGRVTFELDGVTYTSDKAVVELGDR